MDGNRKKLPVLGLGGTLADEQHGFSLIELLVSISILTVIMAGIFTFLWSASTYWSSGRDSAEMTDNARTGLNRMTREIRQASSMSIAQTGRIAFVADFGTGPETITYAFAPGAAGQTGSVWRSTSAVPDQHVTLIDGISTMQFIFYGNDYRCDSDGNGVTSWAELQVCSTTPVAKVARVDIELTISAGKQGGQVFTDQAWLRNRLVTS